MQKRNRPDDANELHRMQMRWRFKRLVRTVVMNIQFMDDEEQGMTMNVKRNVAFLIRQKRKTGILTIKVRGHRSISLSIDIYTAIISG